LVEVARRKQSLKGGGGRRRAGLDGVESPAAPDLAGLTGRVAAAGAAFTLPFTAQDVVAELFAGTVDGGDGSQPTPFSLPGAATLSFGFSVGHTYAARGAYTATVNLSDGDDGTATRTATVRVGDVVVRVFEDRDGNGARDAGEPGAGFQTAYLDVNDNGVRDGDELSAVSNSSGAWSIPLVPTGTYRVRQVLPPGASAAADPAASSTVTVALGQTVGSINLARPYERTYYFRRFFNNIEVSSGSAAG
jgi:hypothetical protein